MRQLFGSGKGPLLLGICLIAALAGGCGPERADASGVEVDCKLEPSPPVVGDAQVSLTLTGPDQKPIQGADVRLEGNMNHAGMKPSFADLRETEPGRYTGTLEFTMGGDWFVIVTAKTPDGKTIERKIDVPGVQSQ